MATPTPAPPICPGCGLPMQMAERCFLPRALEGQADVEPVDLWRWRCATNHVEVGDADAPWRGALPAPVACVTCGYSLRRVPVDAPCPECGTPVAITLADALIPGRSMRPMSWVGRDRHWQIGTVTLAGCGLWAWYLLHYPFWGMLVATLAMVLGNIALARRAHCDGQPVFWRQLGWMLLVLAAAEGVAWVYRHGV